jgi:hypothetical protein
MFILILLFSIKMATVASACVNHALALSACQTLDSSIFNLYINQGLQEGGIFSFILTQNFQSLSQCSSVCNNEGSCMGFDYNCQTGDCAFFKVTDNGHGELQLFAENDHVSGMFMDFAKK